MICTPRTLMPIKLKDILFKEAYQAFQVTEEHLDDFEEFYNWDLEPLMGPTLAKEYVRGPFEGLFIVAGQVVTQKGALVDCYLDLVLPERVCEHCFLQSNNQIVRSRGRRVANGTALPMIAIEKLGVPELFYAKENPNVGIEVLQKGLQHAREKKNIAYDLGCLLRKQKRYEEAISAFTILLDEEPEAWMRSQKQISPILFIRSDAKCTQRLGNTTKPKKTSAFGRLPLPRNSDTLLLHKNYSGIRLSVKCLGPSGFLQPPTQLWVGIKSRRSAGRLQPDPSGYEIP